MFSLPAPKTIEEAQRQIRTCERALQIIDAGYTFEQDPDIDLVSVCKPGHLYSEYIIIDGECTCPDFQHRGGYCKHTLAWQWWQANVVDYSLTIHPASGKFQLTLVTKADEALIAEYEAQEAIKADGECSTGCDYPDHHF